jgi:hypothetical protein
VLSPKLAAHCMTTSLIEFSAQFGIVATVQRPTWQCFPANPNFRRVKPGIRFTRKKWKVTWKDVPEQSQVDRTIFRTSYSSQNSTRPLNSRIVKLDPWLIRPSDLSHPIGSALIFGNDKSPCCSSRLCADIAHISFGLLYMIYSLRDPVKPIHQIILSESL